MRALTRTLLVGSLIAAPSIAVAQTSAVEKVEKRVLTLAGARIVASAAET